MIWHSMALYGTLALRETTCMGGEAIEVWTGRSGRKGRLSVMKLLVLAVRELDKRRWGRGLEVHFPFRPFTSGALDLGSHFLSILFRCS